MTTKIGDFVQCPHGIGMPPKFGYIREEATLKAFSIPVWLIQTTPPDAKGKVKLEAFPKDSVKVFTGED